MYVDDGGVLDGDTRGDINGSGLAELFLAAGSGAVFTGGIDGMGDVNENALLVDVGGLGEDTGGTGKLDAVEPASGALGFGV